MVETASRKRLLYRDTNGIFAFLEKWSELEMVVEARHGGPLAHPKRSLAGRLPLQKLAVVWLAKFQ